MVLVRRGQLAGRGGKRGGGGQGADVKRGLAVAAVAVALAGCGYHVGGHASLIPATIKTIAVPAFGNVTSSYRLPVLLTGDVTRELISRTRYRVVADPNQADATLTGVVVNFVHYPTIFDPISARATGVQAAVTLQLT